MQKIITSESSTLDNFKSWWAKQFVQKQAEQKIEATVDQAAKKLDENLFTKKGLSTKLTTQKDGVYTVIKNTSEEKAIQLNGFTFVEGQRLVDCVVAYNIQNNDNKYSFLFRTAVLDKDGVKNSYAYIGTLDTETNNFNLTNHSVDQSPLAFEQSNCKKKTYINNPVGIATDGKSFFYKPQAVDDLYSYSHGVCADNIEPNWIAKQYGGYLTDLTTSRLQALIGDTEKGNLFFGSAVPNLYVLNQQYKSKVSRTASFIDVAGEAIKELSSSVESALKPGSKIVENGYLISANEGTLIYGRMFNYESWFDNAKRRAFNKLKAFGSKVLPTGWVDAPTLDQEKIYRIGYYAKFFGDTAPSLIKDTEDSDECKMLSPVETVLFGDPLKYYNMVPGAASKDFAVIFLGSSRGMHLAIQQQKGSLFPNLLSWYKILKTQLFVKGSFFAENSNWDPEHIIPRQLFITRQQGPDEKEHNYLIISTQKNVYLMFTPLDKVSKTINENYNVILINLYDAKENNIVKTVLHDDHQAKNGQSIYVIVENQSQAEENDFSKAYSMVHINDFASILQEANNECLKEGNKYESANLRWVFPKKSAQEK
ncbi:hypothetical protein EKK58_03410 [Candidatus Dependentiae bacterium]|nr:MAG: hypothetical protein EKK58_03410 [Candidatus Dependentiae bacterium]